jgi:hypothetical protein
MGVAVCVSHGIEIIACPKCLEERRRQGAADELEQLGNYLSRLGKYKIMTSEMLRKYYDKRILLLENTSTVVEDSRATHSKGEKK